ncbi:MAG TPA: hypothetical protein VI320_23825 [Terracidiphilus sp.]
MFLEGGNVRDDLAPAAEYGRLLASIGINGLNVNNVNAAWQLLDSAHLKLIARIAAALRPRGGHPAMSEAIASPPGRPTEVSPQPTPTAITAPARPFSASPSTAATPSA